jgi:hypothetical protein
VGSAKPLDMSKSIGERRDIRNNPMLVNFIRDALQIPNISWEVLMTELVWKEVFYKSEQNQIEIFDIYQQLDIYRPQLEAEELSSIP